MVADKRNNEDRRKSDPAIVVTTPPGTFCEISKVLPSGGKRRRKKHLRQQDHIHTHTVANVASEAITAKTFSGMM